ncbi:MAG TPA: hypothetical protein VFE70_04080, partial [Candidatus Elarobacter sp.]|nr:hypothetical protein [Candidatus Elarobacter sp.]
TRYFTNVYGASFSASLEEWRDDYYGALFTADAGVLDQPNEMAKGIYWANYWFFWDFISDRIASYRSFMTPSESVSASSAVRAMVRDCLKGKDRAAIPKIVAQNRVSYRFPFWPFEILHGDYLASRWFWLDDCESSKWWAPAWLGFRRPDDRDQAIGALELVTKRDAAVHVAAFAALPITPPSRPAGSADTAVAATSRFDGVPLGHAAATNLVDVLPPG